MWETVNKGYDVKMYMSEKDVFLLRFYMYQITYPRIKVYTDRNYLQYLIVWFFLRLTSVFLVTYDFVQRDTYRQYLKIFLFLINKRLHREDSENV